jgi:hypothetical protein
MKSAGTTGYLNKPLGKFIEDSIKGSARKGGYQAESKTIKGKVVFCEKAIEAIKSWNDLSPQAQTLVTQIYHFIASANPT